MAEIKYRDALNAALREEMERDPLVFCIGEGIGEKGGSFRVTDKLLDQFGSERVIDTPLSEAGFVGLAGGAAIAGTRPVVEMLFIDFTFLVMDQVANQIAKYEFMTGGQGKVPVVLRTQGGIGNGLAGQHSQSLEAMFCHIPGLQVVMPSTPYDAKGLLKTCIRDDNPVIFIENKKLYLNIGEVPEEEYLIPLGKADIKRKGSDITIVTYSYMTHECLKAAEILGQKGISAEVIDLRTLVPLDEKCILDSVDKTGHLIVVHEAPTRGGYGGDILSTVIEKAFYSLEAPARRIAGKNSTIPFNMTLEKLCIPSVDEIVGGAMDVMNS
ncbi:MAG TPA: alpha-ketoacid dehydrogenase subunit beta [Pelolinea sp.]|nr:alpha-ketoacid dehydrogenase subunit beta [Pelolinea sp.]